jgi:hypothetical protein
MLIASKSRRLLTAASAALMLMAGCGKKAVVTADDAPVFDKAGPELKQMWRTLVEQILRATLLEFFEVLLPQGVNLFERFIGLDGFERGRVQQ